MTQVLKIQKNASDGLKELLKYMLAEGKVRGVFGLIKAQEGNRTCYALVTDPDLVEQMDPLRPVMPVSAASQISRYTLDGPISDPVAVVLRPCELRAFVELVKLRQGHLENVLVISMTCPGVYTFEIAKNGGLEGRLPQYWEAASNASIL